MEREVKSIKAKLVNASIADAQIAASPATTGEETLLIPDSPAIMPAEVEALIDSKTEESKEKEPPAVSESSVEQKFCKKFLFVTDEALSVDVAWKIKEEGNEVKMYIGNEDDQDIGEG